MLAKHVVQVVVVWYLPQKNNAEADALKAQRLTYEEALRVAAETKKREELKRLRLECAVYTIQNAWRVWKKKKAAEAKKAAGRGKGSTKGKK